MAGLRTGNHADMRAVAGSDDTMSAIARSDTAMLAIAGSDTAMSAVTKSVVAMKALAETETALDATVRSEIAVTAVAASQTAMNAVAASQTAMEAVANSAAALNAIVKSELACIAIEAGIQNYRTTVVNTLSSPSLFKKQSGYQLLVNSGANSDTRAIKTTGASSLTIYVPTSFYGDIVYGVDLMVESLLTGKQLSQLYNKGSKSTTNSGIAIRGVQLTVKGKYGYVNFDIYTAV